jgi:outer membrane protein OmpA-like peptidoglycan-associated protein
MNANLMDAVKDYLSPDVIKKIGAHVGEAPDATQRGLNTAVPAVMGGFVRQATSDSTGGTITRTLAAVQRGEPGETMEDPSSMIGKGQGLLGSLFGDRLPSAVGHVAQSSGLSHQSAGKLLALAAPIVGAVVAREAGARKLSPGGVAGMLTEHKGAVAGALGAGGLASIFGGAEPTEMRAAVQPSHVGHRLEAMRYRAGTPEGRPAGRRIGMPFLLLGLLVFLAVLMLFGRHKAPIGTNAPNLTQKGAPYAEAPRAPTAEVPAPPAAPAIPSVEGPGQPAPPAIGGGPSTATSALDAFFADPNEPTPKSIPLEGVTFDHDSTQLSGASASSIAGVAAELKAHPTAQVRIDGYTDDTGDPGHNMTLSADRANAVRDALIRQGVDASRITIAGKGSDNPVGPNDTEEGRAANRRIELVVTSR